MTVVENSVEVSKSDLELQNDTLANEIVDKSHKAMSQKIEIKTMVLNYADNLEQLVERKIYSWPKEFIFSIILENLSRKGISMVGRQYIYEAFNSEEYDKFKLIKKYGWHANKEPQNNSQSSQQSTAPINNLITQEKAAVSSQINDALLVLEQNYENPQVKDRLAKYFSQYEKEHKKEKQQVKDLDRICMEKPESEISSFSEALRRLSKLASIAADRVESYPPLNEQDDSYYTSGVLLYTKWIQSIADLKHSRSNYSWIDIQIEKVSQSTHSAMSKSKIESRSKEFAHLNGMLRKVTREQIDAKEPIILDIAKEVTKLAPMIIGKEMGDTIRDIFDLLIEEDHPYLLFVAAKIIENSKVLIGIDLYKDLCQAPWNGGFHLRRHDKLSESAFGNSSLS